MLYRNKLKQIYNANKKHKTAPHNAHTTSNFHTLLLCDSHTNITINNKSQSSLATHLCDKIFNSYIFYKFIDESTSENTF